MEKVKVLITGSVNNDFPSLVTKLSTLQKSKAGPFHVCFCAGPFFMKGGNGVTLDSHEESEQLKKAQKFLEEGSPIPIYFCDLGQVPSGLSLPKQDDESKKDDAEIDLDCDDNDGEDDKSEKGNGDDGDKDALPKGIVEIAKNVYHLHGISFESSQTADILSIHVNDRKQYLTVAFMPPNARMGTAQTAKFEAKTAHPSFIGCDILLTSEWGQGIAGSSCLNKADVESLQQNIGVDCNLNELGSFDVAEIASKSRPRYHFAPSLFNANSKIDWYDSSLYLQSLPYTNPPSALSSGVIKNYHTSRFLSLCPVVESKRAKAGGKKKKFIHALGVQPLWSMDRVTATEVPKNVVVVSNPYTDEGYSKDEVDGQKAFGKNEANGIGNGSGGMNNLGLSEAQTRRIMCEENNNDQYRWNVANRNGNRKRPLDSSKMEVDESNCTLFLHGLHKDVSRGVNLNRRTIFAAFQLDGCVRVRYPGNDNDVGMNGRMHSFCFLEFPTHQKALQCLGKSGGMIEIAGVTLNLKWSSGSDRSKRKIPPPPPPGFSGVMTSQDREHKRQRTELSEAEAMDSSTLFIYIKANSQEWSEERGVSAILKLERLAQKKLEDAINGGEESSERVTAEDEPALKVKSRKLPSKSNCGFLDFASHAAASMALATMTGSTNGGNLLDEFKIKDDNGDVFQEDMQIWWGKKTSPVKESRHNFQKHHFPLDARTDCWFCLASPTCEKHLIVSLAEYSYITMPKGGVNEHHALIVPINHSGAENDGEKHVIGAFLEEPSIVQEMEETKEMLRRHANEKLGKDLLVFERAIPTKGGYHAHINCIPVERGLGSKIRATMTSMASTKSKYGNGFDLREIQNPDIGITSLLKNDEDLDGYFYIEIPFGGKEQMKRFLYKFNSSNKDTKLPSVQFGREILASVLEKPEIASWKNCVLSKEEEERLANDFSTSIAS